MLRRRRMVRSFSGRPVSSDVLDVVLGAAMRAPSAGNTGGWSAVVLQGWEQTDTFWQATTTPEWRERSQRWPGLSMAPVIVALFVELDAYLDRYSEPDKARSGLGSAETWPVPYWFVDAGMTVSLLLMAALDNGLGACFLGNFRGESALMKVLEVPAGHRYVGAVLLGEPGKSDPPSRSLSRAPREKGDVYHWARWGAATDIRRQTPETS